MGYFPVRYDSRVVIYKRKTFIRLATGQLFITGLFIYKKKKVQEEKTKKNEIKKQK